MQPQHRRPDSSPTPVDHRPHGCGARERCPYCGPAFDPYLTVERIGTRYGSWVIAYCHGERRFEVAA
jgi:hypothetical protein